MSRWKFALAAMVALPLLGACHGDIFSIKPETNASVPKKTPDADPAPQAEPSDDAETPPQ
ncbi:hypothetical protein [Hyphomonas sp.]|uniref:hypothetical protein n=1 Tax=Hyphomonas sp. TaxID=87 RepID=UPI0030F7F4DF